MKAVAAIALMIVAIGCRSEEQREPSERARLESVETPEVTPSTPPPPLFERHAAPEPELDPARVPVEEDFIYDAERRIGKNAKLELELARLKQEIASGPR